MPTATANGKTFTFPEGVTPEQMGEAIDEYFAANDIPENSEQPEAPEEQTVNTRKRGGRSANAGNESPVIADPNQGNALDAVYEPTKAILGGMANTAISGLAGLGNVIQNYDSAQGADKIREVQESLPDFSPETEAGKKGLQTVGDLMQAGIDIVNYPISGLAGLASLVTGGDINQTAQTVADVQDKGLGQTLGDKTLDATNNPALATGAMMLPDFAGAFLGGKGVQAGINKTLTKLPKRTPKALIDDSGELRGDFKKALESQDVTLENIFPDDIANLPANVKPKQAAEMIVTRKLKAGDSDGFLATKKLSDDGFVIDDDIAKSAISQGFQDGDVQLIKTAADATKRKFVQMVYSRRKIKGNTREAMVSQPSSFIGEAAMDRILLIRDKADNARQNLNELVDTRLSNTPVDVARVAQKFAEELKALKVDVVDGKPVFEGSLISADQGAKRTISSALKLMNEPGSATAQRAHELKRQLDNMINWKRSSSQLTPAGEGFARSIRRELNQVIRDVDSDYAMLNDTLSSSIEKIEDFESAMGSRFSILDGNAAEKAGTRLRKMLTRYGVSDDQIKLIQELDDFANDLGGNFSDSISDLVMFNRILEDKFGSVRRGSLGPEIEKNIERALRGKDGIKDIVIDKTAEYAKAKLLNKNDYEALRSLERLSATINKPRQSRSGRSIVKKQ